MNVTPVIRCTFITIHVKTETAPCAMIHSEASVLSDREQISKDNIVSGLNVLEKSGEFDYAYYISNRNSKYMSDGKVSNALLSDYESIVDATIDYSVFRNIHPKKNAIK